MTGDEIKVTWHKMNRNKMRLTSVRSEGRICICVRRLGRAVEAVKRNGSCNGCLVGSNGCTIGIEQRHTDCGFGKAPQFEMKEVISSLNGY